MDKDYDYKAMWIPSVPQDKPIATAKKKSNVRDLTKAIIDAGGIQIAYFEGEKRFILGEKIVDGNANTVDNNIDNYRNAIARSSVSIILADMSNPELNIVFNHDMQLFVTYPIDYNKNNYSFTVEINKSTGEIIKGSSELKSLGYKKPIVINKKEQDIINICELVDFYALEECRRIIGNFDICKNKAEYDIAYKKHYKNIIKFRTNNE